VSAGSDATPVDVPLPHDDVLPPVEASLAVPIAHFSFDTSFNDDSNTYAGATIGTGVTRTPGHSGNALTLGGAGCLKMSVETPNAFTIAFWAQPNDTAGGVLVSRDVMGGTTGAKQAYQVYDTVGGGFGFSLWDGSNENDHIATGEFVPATFRHYAVTFDGGTKRWFVDGLEVTAPQSVGPIVYGPDGFVFIGCQEGPQSFFNGMIDELYLYGEALDPTQISTLAQQ